MQECARAVLLTPTGLVLLMKIVGWERELWILPGGRIQDGEDAVSALKRELLEETGHTPRAIEGPIWVRRGSFQLTAERRVEEREQFFLVPTEQFEPDTSGFEPAEIEQHLGFRWWSIPEIEVSMDHIVPARLAEHLQSLRDNGPPPQPLDVSG